MPIIEQKYVKDGFYSVLSPLEDRLGQLGEGALQLVSDTLDLGTLPNVIELEEGDSLFFISDESELSGDDYAEIVIGNTEEFLIVDIDDRNVQLDHSWVAEPNDTNKFYEYKVRRRISQRDFTFARTLQVDFSAGAVFFYVNGVAVTPTLTNPSSEITLLTWAGGTIQFVPLGDSRYRCEPRITVDANIEVIVPDSVEAVEIRLSNLDVLQDLPLWMTDGQQDNFLPWLRRRVEIMTAITGLTYTEGEKGIDVRIVTSKPGEQQAQAGSTTEFFVTLVVGEAEDLLQVEGSVIYCDGRELTEGIQQFYLLAENVSPGVVKVTVPAAEIPTSGVIRCQMVIYPGGTVEQVVRTNHFLLTVLP